MYFNFQIFIIHTFNVEGHFLRCPCFPPYESERILSAVTCSQVTDQNTAQWLQPGRVTIPPTWRWRTDVFHSVCKVTTDRMCQGVCAVNDSGIIFHPKPVCIRIINISCDLAFNLNAGSLSSCQPTRFYFKGISKVTCRNICQWKHKWRSQLIFHSNVGNNIKPCFQSGEIKSLRFIRARKTSQVKVWASISCGTTTGLLKQIQTEKWIKTS